MKFGLIGAVLLATALGGCASNSAQIASLSLAEACNAYAGALTVLAPQKHAGALSDRQIAQINYLNLTVDPICSNPIPPADPVDAATRVTTAVSQAMLVVYAQQKAGN